MRNTNMQHIIRVAAGVYVAYMGYKILRDGVLGGGMTGKSRTFGLVFSIVFIVVGAGLAVLALRNLNRAREAQEAERENEAEAIADDLPEPTPAEEIPAQKTLFDRAAARPLDGEEEEPEQTGDPGINETDLS